MDPSHTHQIKIAEGENSVGRSVTTCQARSFSDKEGMNKLSSFLTATEKTESVLNHVTYELPQTCNQTPRCV